MSRKILYSPGFGAGWTTWASGDEMILFMLEYQPFIEALEREETLNEKHPAWKQFEKECQEKFGEVPYMGGVDQLCVAEVEGRVRINEYDGNESVEEEGGYSG